MKFWTFFYEYPGSHIYCMKHHSAQAWYIAVTVQFYKCEETISLFPYHSILSITLSNTPNGVCWKCFEMLCWLCVHKMSVWIFNSLLLLLSVLYCWKNRDKLWQQLSRHFLWSWKEYSSRKNPIIGLSLISAV